MTGCYLNDLGIVCALGDDTETIRHRLMTGDQAGIISSDSYQDQGCSMVGKITADLPALPDNLMDYHSRNNRIATLALEQIRAPIDSFIDRFGPHRVGIVMGTSTSGISDGEAALEHYNETGRYAAGYNYKQQEIGGLSNYISRYLNISGPSYTISTACSSSAIALASARRLLALNAVDMVITGGVDSLCRLTVQGFSSLDSVSKGRCNPFSVNRDGMTIGEAAAIFIMSRQPANVALLGTGSSSDAYHISAPSPDGKGAVQAMQRALKCANLAPEDIDYLNLHGTGTRQNDAMESIAVNTLLGADTPCSSTKAITGHALGAAGALEAGLCWQLLNGPAPVNRPPPHVWDGETDPDLAPINLVKPGYESCGEINICMSNSFAFGGNNCSLILGRSL